MYCTCLLSAAGCVVILVVYRWLFLQWPLPPPTVITVTAAIALQFYANSSATTNNSINNMSNAMCQWKLLRTFWGLHEVTAPLRPLLAHSHVQSTCDAGKYWLPHWWQAANEEAWQEGAYNFIAAEKQIAHFVAETREIKFVRITRQANKCCLFRNIKKGSAVRVATQIEFRVNSVCALMSNLLQWSFINGWRGRGGGHFRWFV